MTKHTFPQSVTKLAIFTFLIANFFYLYDYLLQVSPGAISHYLMKELSLNATLLGVISSCYFCSYAALQIPAGILVDRYGAHIVMVVVIFICAVGTLIFGSAENVLTLFIGRLLIGAGSAFAFVSTLYLVCRWFPPRHFAFLAGIVASTGSIGSIVGISPLTFILKSLSWQQLFLLLSSIGFALSLIVLLFIRNHPKDCMPVKHQQSSIYRHFMQVIRNSQNWFISLYGLLMWAPIISFIGLWGITFLQTSYLTSPLQASYYLTAICVGVIIASPLLGWLSERMGRRKPLLIITAMTGFVSFGLILYVPNLPKFIIYFFMICLGISSGGFPVMFAFVKDNNETYAASTAIGFSNMLCVLSGAIFQPIVGQLLDLTWNGTKHNNVPIYTLHSFHLALSLLLFCFLIALIISLFFLRETYCLPIDHRRMAR